VIYCLFGGGGQYRWYRIVSYQYTMLILSIVSNRPVSPTSSIVFNISYVIKRWLRALLSGSREHKSDCGFLWIYLPGPWIHYQDYEY